jgi:hypothetical protein
MRTSVIYSNMHPRSKSSLRLLELDLPLLHTNKPLRGSLVKLSCPSLVKKRQWRRIESYKPIDFESIETLFHIRSSTPTILHKTPRTLRADQADIATKLDTNRHLRAVIGPTASQARAYESNAYLTYDSAQVPAATPKEFPETYKRKPRARTARRLVRRTTPVGRNSILFKPQNSKPEMSASSLRPSIVKSRLFRLTA